MNLLKRPALLLFSFLLVVYLYGLSDTGLLGPDEPRYAAIGREMARSGDYVAPVLWGDPWFEKPPFLYWTTAALTRVGFGPEVGPRLPVAVQGWAFLVFLWWIARREFGDETALYSAAILGTSIGWLAYSFVAVTDIPLSALLCAAMLISLYRQGIKWSATAGVLLGGAILAKGLVPVILFAPVLWPLRRRMRDLVVTVVVCVAVAAPWYALMTARFGMPFLVDFFWKHHFQRFATDALAHVRPWWFYVPVLIGFVLPWTPALAAIRRDRRTAFLAAWLAFALVFFSVSRNKLPGYILPMLPPVALLMAHGLATLRNRRPLLLGIAALAGLLPVIATVMPEALRHGLKRSHFEPAAWSIILAVIVVALGFFATWRGSRAPLYLAMVTGLAVLGVKAALAPALDHEVSARSAWISGKPTCVPQTADRDREYGLNYYAGRQLPRCAQ